MPPARFLRLGKIANFHPMPLDPMPLDPMPPEPPTAAPAVRSLWRGREWGVSEYLCTAGPGDSPFEERHEKVAIAAVIAGTFTYRADAGSAVLHPGAFLLGNAAACYECGHEHSHGDHCISFQAAPEYFGEVAASMAGSSRFRFSAPMLPATAGLLPLLARIEARTAFAEPLDIDETAAHLIEAVLGFMSDHPPKPVRVSPRDGRRIGEALRYIELNVADALDLDTLAGVAIMSKYHFLRTFRHVVGMTPYQFLLAMRMRRTAVRLATSTAPVSAIALEAGFGDLSTFNARFRKTFGVSPTAFRRHRRL
jgi:AraC family transcriptional regulator